MKRVNQLGWLVLAGGALLAFPACGDDDDSTGNTGGSPGHAGAANGGAPDGAGGAGSDGSIECQVVGLICHEADTGSGAAHDCHEVGHEGDGSACLAKFAGCINTCVAEAAPDLTLADARCAALGELCHPVDDKDGPLHACHVLGESGNCAEGFADCAQLCLTARKAVEAGEGGAGGGSGTEHGHDEGGAAGQGGATAAAGTAGNAG
jgi:hypothetical protein